MTQDHSRHNQQDQTAHPHVNVYDRRASACSHRPWEQRGSCPALARAPRSPVTARRHGLQTATRAAARAAADTVLAARGSSTGSDAGPPQSAFAEALAEGRHPQAWQVSLLSQECPRVTAASLCPR